MRTRNCKMVGTVRMARGAATAVRAVCSGATSVLDIVSRIIRPLHGADAAAQRPCPEQLIGFSVKNICDNVVMYSASKIL